MTVTQSLSALLSSNWTKVGFALSLLGLGAATAKTFTEIREVPHVLARHDSTNTELLKELNHTASVQLCLNIAQLRHSDWTRCLIGEP